MQQAEADVDNSDDYLETDNNEVSEANGHSVFDSIPTDTQFSTYILVPREGKISVFSEPLLEYLSFPVISVVK